MPPSSPQAPALMEKAPVGAALAFVSGSLNTFTFLNAGIFATVQSGNVLSSAMSFSAGDWGRALMVLTSIGGFFLGAALGGVLVTLFQRRGLPYSPTVLGAQALLILLVAALWGSGVIPESSVGAHIACMLIAVPAGAQGTAFHKVDGMMYGNVAVTAVVQGAADYLAQLFLARDSAGRKYYARWAARFSFVVLGFAAGAGLGVVIGLLAGAPAATFTGTATASTWVVLLVPAVTLAILSALAQRAVARGQNPDPAKGSGLIY